MKKLLLILSLILAVLFVNCGQSKEDKLRNTICDIFVEKVLEKTSGVIIKKENTKKSYIIATSVPTIFDSDLVLLTVTSVANSYSDMKTYRAWERNSNILQKSYEVGENHLINITYSDKDKLLIFGIITIK